jgi:hypothetical protein
MVYLLITVSVLARFIPHLHNFSPVYGALLFGGAYLKKRDSIWFPVVLLVASDYVLTDVVYRMGDIGWLELFQAAAFASVAFCGWMLRGKFRLQRFALACLAGPAAFFVISNLGVWYGYGTFPRTAAGLLECYIAGIPYYGRTLVSTVLFAGFLFGFQEYWAWRQAHSSDRLAG